MLESASFFLFMNFCVFKDVCVCLCCVCVFVFIYGLVIALPADLVPLPFTVKQLGSAFYFID